MRYTSILRSMFLAFGVAAALGLGQARGDGEAARSPHQQVLDWLTANAKFSSDQAGSRIRGRILEEIDAGKDLIVTFGAGFMQSGRPCQLHSFAGRLYVFELSDSQAAKLLEDPGTMTIESGKPGYTVEPARVELGCVKIDGADHQDPRKKIVGEVSYKVHAALPSGVAVRLSYRFGSTSTQKFFYPENGLSAGEGTLHFSLDPMEADSSSEPAKAGPRAVFVDICSLPKEEDPSAPGVKTFQTHVLSNSTAALLDITPATDSSLAAVHAPASTLVGTKWRFDGMKTTVEFLEGGVVRWDGALETTTHWKQDGNSVEINANDFTLFRFTLNGNTLKGTWERLKGGDAGQKNPSNLTKVTATDSNPAAVPAPASTLVGTKWRFDGMKTTVEFLEGGVVRWDGALETTTHWKQDGNSVEINANDFTLFRFTLNGNTLKGTWERLKGDEVGQKNPSGLTKVTD